jgi:hypothetical protein
MTCVDVTTIRVNGNTLVRAVSKSVKYTTHLDFLSLSSLLPFFTASRYNFFFDIVTPSPSPAPSRRQQAFVIVCRSSEWHTIIPIPTETASAVSLHLSRSRPLCVDYQHKSFSKSSPGVDYQRQSFFLNLSPTLTTNVSPFSKSLPDVDYQRQSFFSISSRC